MADKEPAKTQYSLKDIEAQYLRTMIESHQAQLSNFLTLTAVERLAYKVTVNTKFNILPGAKSLEIWEEEPAPEVPGLDSSVAKSVKEGK